MAFGVGGTGVLGSHQGVGFEHGFGVLGQVNAGWAVRGKAVGLGTDAYGVWGETSSPLGDGGHFENHSLNQTSTGAGLWAGSVWGSLIEAHELALDLSNLGTRFRVAINGNVFAHGSYNCGLSIGCFNSGLGADVAERIDATEPLEPGEVVEIDPGVPGKFRKCRQAYSRLAAGVVSTRPAMTLNNNDLSGNRTGARTDDRPLLALVGKVPVKATAENGAIRPGDLLVASTTPGHAMRCQRPDRCVGRTIGKALEPLERNTGRILALVMLR